MQHPFLFGREMMLHIIPRRVGFSERRFKARPINDSQSQPESESNSLNLSIIRSENYFQLLLRLHSDIYQSSLLNALLFPCWGMKWIPTPRRPPL